MIYDTVSNLAYYKGIHPNLDRGLAFLEETKLNDLPFGKTEIDGNKVFVNIIEAKLQEPNREPFEFHKKYLDIQLDLEGEEIIGIGFSAVNDSKKYDVETDFGTICCQEEILLPLGIHRFIICMPKEPHKPGIKGRLIGNVKKCVVKVLIE